MSFREFINSGSSEAVKELFEDETKLQALGMAKDVQSKLADLTFIDMMALMNPDNPATKEIQDLETELNDLTAKIGDFIQKYIPAANSDNNQDGAKDKKPVKPNMPKDDKGPPEKKPADQKPVKTPTSSPKEDKPENQK